MKKIRVLVADPEILLRELLVRQLRQEPDLQVVAVASEGEEAVQMAREADPDVLIVKLLMPRLNGVQVAERIAAWNPKIRSLLLTSVDGTESLVQLAGGHACLHTHRCGISDILGSVRKLYGLQDSDLNALPEQQAAVAWVAARIALTPRETRVLEAVVCSEMTVGQIAQSLSRTTGEKVTNAAVRHALARVMDKLRLEPRTRVALVKLVLDVGGNRRTVDTADCTPPPSPSSVSHLVRGRQVSCTAFRSV